MIQPNVDMGPEIPTFIDQLRARGLEVIDNRSLGGVLWVVGGVELTPIMEEFEVQEIKFWPASGRATGFRAGWYTNWRS